MSFKRLTWARKFFTLAMTPGIVLGGYFVWLQALPDNWPLGLLLGVMAFATSAWPLDWKIKEHRFDLPFAATCVALAIIGPGAAVLVALCGALGQELPHTNRASWDCSSARPPFHQIWIAFGVRVTALVLAVPVQAYALRTTPAPDVFVGPLAMLAFLAVAVPIGTALECLDEALKSRLRFFALWNQRASGAVSGLTAPAVLSLVLAPLPHSWQAFALVACTGAWVLARGQQIHLAKMRMLQEKMDQDMVRIRELNQLNRTIMASLCTAIDAKDSYTSSHINRVQTYALAVAKAAGLGHSDVEAVATGALVHDIGKLGIPDHILGKPGKLTPEEFKRIQSHVAIGVDILSPIPFAFPVLEVVRSHHERWDGLGYPQGLKGEQIPIGARIISIVDVFDAVTSDRPYRKAMSHEEAMEVLKQGSGKQFDPLLVELFIEVLPHARLEIQQMEAAQRRRARASGEEADGNQALNHIKHAAAEMAAVADVAHALSQQETLDGITDIVADKTLSLLPADTVVIFLKDPENRELVASSVRGRYSEKLSTMTISLGEGVTGWVVANQQAKVNASAALDVARRFSPEENIELSAVTAVPLVHGPETLGAIAVYTMGYSVIQEPHVYLLNTIAEHLAGAIQNQLRFVEHRDMAFTDPLTGLVNSRGVYKEMERLVAAGNADLRECFSVLMMDLDRFKEVNDTLGHLRGDDLLRTVASGLNSVSRPNDIVCRYAGDEFVMILPGVRPDQAERIAMRAQEAIECLPPVDGKIQIGVSIGLASFPLDGKDSRDLLHSADLRMYEDKLRRKSGHTLAEGLRFEFDEARVAIGV